MQRKIIDCLNNIALFDKLKPNELETISKYVYIIKITKGEILFNEEDKGDHVCFIIDGKLDVLKLVFDSCRYTKLEKPCQSRDTAIHSKWRSAYKIRGWI
ncbi:cyclic nucleotide-binding domain-containing protein [Desulfobacula sp.]|uniref:cyclic nucleotide-binding domain-containing protein n=1 Tax=Desulfobacula sp. TaxID=2593537 RepID=UPI00261FE55E|nr:cyclic nucleotide-binding domain-containing protein [Desulfobacula sp.]